MGSKLLDVLRLYRLHTALVTAAVPAIAAHIAGGSTFLIAGVVLGSVSHHAWGFSLNEIMDIDIDRRNRELSHKPLVARRISKRSAWILSLGALFLSFASFGASVVIENGSIVPALVFLIMATAVGAIYDLFGKRFPLSDVFVALWMFFLVLAGAGAVSGWGPFPLGVWAAAVLGFLHLLFNNSVEGGLKDVENDRRSGARTLAVITGVKVKKGYLEVSRSFIVWGALLRVSFAIGASIFVLFMADEADIGNWIVVLVPVVGIFLFTHSLTFMGEKVKMDRNALINAFAVHELISFGLSMLVVLPAAGAVAAVLAFSIPLLWVFLFNRLIFRTGLAPKV